MTDDIVARLRAFNGVIAEEDCRSARLAADYIEHQHASHDMMVEKIERLTRELKKLRANWREVVAGLDGACDRAEAAERKVEKLREALREIEKFYGTEPWQLTKTMKETARAALAETESE